MTTIAIVGAGLSALSAAFTLEQLGYSPILFEASDSIGGRVKSAHIDGFTCDQGFHAILSSSSEIFSLIDKKDLELSFFPSGVMVRHNNEWISVLNPIRDPEKMVFGKETFFFDFLKLSKLYLKQKMQKGQRADLESKEQSSFELLKSTSLSEPFIEELIRPFCAAIFFEQELHTASSTFLRVLPRFIEGKAGLPKQGIQIMPALIAQKLKRTEIRLNTKVEKIEKGKLYLKDAVAIDTDKIILATSLEEAKQFLSPLTDCKTLKVTCFYFSISAHLIDPLPFLYLNAERSEPINHFCFTNLTQPSYAPQGKLLLSATVVDPLAQKDPILSERVKKQLSSYFYVNEKEWKEIASYCMLHALPDQTRPPFYHGKYRFNREKGIYLCGETVDSSSYDDALASGRHAAEMLHQDMLDNQDNF